MSPAALPAPADRRGLWESAPGAFLLDVPGVVRYLATDGRDVLVKPTGGDDAGVFLIGPVFAAVLRHVRCGDVRKTHLSQDAPFPGGSRQRVRESPVAYERRAGRFEARAAA